MQNPALEAFKFWNFMATMAAAFLTKQGGHMTKWKLVKITIESELEGGGLSTLELEKKALEDYIGVGWGKLTAEGPHKGKHVFDPSIFASPGRKIRESEANIDPEAFRLKEPMCGLTPSPGTLLRITIEAGLVGKGRAQTLVLEKKALENCIGIGWGKVTKGPHQGKHIFDPSIYPTDGAVPRKLALDSSTGATKAGQEAIRLKEPMCGVSLWP